jgi:molybdenum cofactor cytidylyltransferase
MNLAKALGISAGESVAFVGAGGKTSAMFALAQDLKSPVVLTTTTHLGVWQAGLAEDHQIVQSPEEIHSLEFDNFQTLLITGPAGADERLSGLDEATLEALHSRCQRDGIVLLMEADGARQRNLKAPADYEPVVPAWVDRVVVMAGLEALGKPLTAEWVHRPEIFSDLSGLPMRESIRVEEVVTVLGSDHGGLKGIPDIAHCQLFLNQADGSPLMAKGNRIAQQLSDKYERVLIGSLHQPEQEGSVFSTHSEIAGVVLAAGGSERLGKPKQLLAWQGKPFIYQVVINAVEAGLAPLVVITGADHLLVEEVLRYLSVQIVHNPDWKEGQSTSLKAGLAALPDRCEGVMFLLSDQPQISPLLIRGLLELFYEHRAPITAPMVNGQRGNPVLFARETFDALRKVSGDRGGRAVFNQFEIDWLPWIDERLLLDVDEEGDLDSLNRVYNF